MSNLCGLRILTSFTSRYAVSPNPELRHACDPFVRRSGWIVLLPRLAKTTGEVHCQNKPWGIIRAVQGLDQRVESVLEGELQ